MQKNMARILLLGQVGDGRNEFLKALCRLLHQLQHAGELPHILQVPQAVPQKTEMGISYAQYETRSMIYRFENCRSREAYQRAFSQAAGYYGWAVAICSPTHPPAAELLRQLRKCKSRGISQITFFVNGEDGAGKEMPAARSQVLRWLETLAVQAELHMPIRAYFGSLDPISKRAKKAPINDNEEVLLALLQLLQDAYADYYEQDGAARKRAAAEQAHDLALRRAGYQKHDRRTENAGTETF